MVDWIISSSILIAVVLVLRRLLKGKISLRLQYALWALVLLRLLVPFSIGSSGLSVMNLARKVPAVQDAASVGGIRGIWHTDTGSVEGYPSYALMPETPVPAAAGKTEAAFARTERALALRSVFVPVWLCGAAVFLAAFAGSNSRFSARLRRTRRPLEGTGAALPVYVTGAVDTPCLFGLFRPEVYLTPEAAEDATVLRHTVAHEMTHFRHGDHVWAILRVICLALHWYNPLVWRAAILSRNDAELACDEATMNRIGESERAEYGRTLIAMTCRKHTSLLITATTMTGSQRSLKERILLIAEKPKMAVDALIAVVLMAAVAAGCTFTGARQTESPAADPAALTGLFAALASEQTPIQLTLTADDGSAAAGTYSGWGCGNDRYYSNQLSNYTFQAVSAQELSAGTCKITLSLAGSEEGWSAQFYDGSNGIRLRTRDGTDAYYQAAPVQEPADPVGTILRLWYDEAELQGIGGTYGAQEQIVIPNRGQDALTAAREHCEALAGKTLLVSPGSKFRCTYVSCRTEAAEEETTRFRESGEIGENTFAFYVTTVFVPENDRARDWSMAGNTAAYTGTDPNVPEEAYEHYRCGYITLAADGWHGNLVGTGW